MKEIRIVTPVGMLGYGIPREDFHRAIEAGAQAVIVDSGSTDPGPYQLGLGAMLASPEAYARDLRIILEGIGKRRIPLLIGSAGGSGTARQVNDLIAIIGTIAGDLGRRLKVAAIYADVDASIVRDSLASGHIAPCASAPPLTVADIDASTHIVAQMGAEPILKVLREQPDVDVVVCGRAYDPSPFAAFCMLHGIDAPGTYWHMGKIMECGGVCAEPKGKVILATVREDSFDLTPMSPHERCTPLSVAAHTLYEKTRPDLLAGPGGMLDLTASQYEQIDLQTTRVRGSVFRPSEGYQVKLEGAAVCGYRTIFIGGVRDPILIGQIDPFLERVRARMAGIFPELEGGEARLHFHVYGKHAVMGQQELLRDAVPHEVGVLGEVTAPTQALANAICSATRIGVLHMPYPGQKATAGNFALPLNPPENAIGPVCRFSIYHLMTVDAPDSLFPYRMLEV
ncbi:acyclic terpene utilization AtuA family protein [Cupriavidus lacunae]|nr:acyclic terpene utilization AtuA family protein [Cupriavidus lacunae]